MKIFLIQEINISTISQHSSPVTSSFTSSPTRLLELDPRNLSFIPPLSILTFLPPSPALPSKDMLATPSSSGEHLCLNSTFRSMVGGCLSSEIKEKSSSDFAPQPVAPPGMIGRNRSYLSAQSQYSTAPEAVSYKEKASRPRLSVNSSTVTLFAK